jgi:hypothetical protein
VSVSASGDSQAKYKQNSTDTVNMEVQQRYNRAYDIKRVVEV